MRPHLVPRTALLTLLGLAALYSAAAAGPITIGPGPVLGSDRAGTVYRQEFQDWAHADLKALDPADDSYAFGDGHDASRDVVAFCEREEGGNVYFRVDLLDLALNAENGKLDLYLAIDCASGGQPWFPDYTNCQTDHPWELCLGIYSSGTVAGTNFKLYDQGFNTPYNSAYLGAYFNSQLDAVEFGIARSALLSAGWDGSRPLYFQVFTTKDFATTSCASGSKLADSFTDPDRGCSDGFYNGAFSDRDSAGVVYYASVAHGNQSVNRNADIRQHVYDPESNTHISGGTGFVRTLDTHRIFGVPLNIHPSGTLTTALRWAKSPSGPTDPGDGPAFLDSIRTFVDSDQARNPGALVGGVFAEHILPYFEGAVNAKSLALTDSLNQACYGVGAAEAGVMHVPERVIRQQPTGMSPLTGRTFDDLAASPYQATYLDEVTHLHHWFYPGESRWPDQPYRHKLHRVNGFLFFCINDREDQQKFGNDDGGALLDTRRSLLEKARSGDARQLVLVFDDWEALAGKSFDPNAGVPVANNNPIQYQNTVRWLANRPWVRVVTLKSMLDRAASDPAWIVDHGTRTDLSLQTYEWLKHASENSYHNWYYDQDGGVTGNEQDFYNLVPVITGAQGDYHARGATPSNDGPPLPSGRRHGDLNTPGTLLREAWLAIDAAPAGALKELAWLQYQAMIYETAWHEEEQNDYSATPYQNWSFPDNSWDGVNTWALRLQNHARDVGLLAAAAQWADSVRSGAIPAAPSAVARDLDQDGLAEYVLRNNRLLCVFERWGGRMVLAVAYDPASREGVPMVGPAVSNPASPGEEEGSGSGATRCTAFKDMNGGTYTDAAYSVSTLPGGFRFTAPDGKIQKDLTLGSGSDTLRAAYLETVSGPLYVRLGLSPNARDMVYHGRDHLVSASEATPVQNGTWYELANSAAGRARVLFGGATWNPSPSYEDADRRSLPLTEEVELSGNASFTLALVLNSGASVVGVPSGPGLAAGPRVALSAVRPSPGRGPFAAALFLAAPAAAARIGVYDVQGRRVLDLGRRSGESAALGFAARDAAGRPLSPGVYFLRAVTDDGAAASRRFVVLR
jgi:hypothetical protein